MDKGHCMLNARILQAQGYTQVQIAEMLGVSDRTVRNYLKELSRRTKEAGAERASLIPSGHLLRHSLRRILRTMASFCMSGLSD
jgi:predicted transcriptional regulator